MMLPAQWVPPLGFLPGKERRDALALPVAQTGGSLAEHRVRAPGPGGSSRAEALWRSRPLRLAREEAGETAPAPDSPNRPKTLA